MTKSVGARPEADDSVERVRPGSVVETTRSLSALLAAGLPLTRALETTKAVVSDEMVPVLEDVLLGVNRGQSLAHALREHPDVFTPMYVGVVRAGERSGRLAPIMARLADELERQEELRQKVVSAMVYPAALISVGLLSIGLLLLFVVPRFAELLVDVGATLPPVTAALLATSEAFQAGWLYLVVATLGVAIGVSVYGTTEDGQRALARFTLALPVIGGVRRGIVSARFARVLSVLLEGGAPLVAALADTAQSVADPLAEDEVRRIQEDVRIGSAFASSLESSVLFPIELTRLVSVGEESGRLSEFLGRAADLLERRATRATERAVTLLEPAVIVLFGGVVAVVALALLQAIYGVNAGAFG